MGDFFYDSDESLPDEETSALSRKRSYILVAIDTHDSMFNELEDKQPAFVECIEACYQVADQLIMADKSLLKGQLALFLAESDPQKIKVIDFEDSLVESIKLLKNLRKLSKEDLENIYKRKDDFDLGDFFLHCRKKLEEIKGSIFKKTLIYITNNDEPVFSNDDKQRKVANQAQIFPDSQTQLHMLTFNENFNTNKFFYKIIELAKGPSLCQIKNADFLARLLLHNLHFNYRKCFYKFFPYYRSSENYINVVVNKYIQTIDSVRNNMYVTRDTQKEVKKTSRMQTSKDIQTDSYEFKFIEETLKFTEAEKAQLLESPVPVGLSLLYVSKESLPYGWVYKKSSLIEKNNNEADPQFDIMWQYCRENNCCFVCAQKYRTGGDVSIVELIPKYINNTRMFMSRVLPYQTDIAIADAPKPDPIKEVEDEEEAVTSLVEALTFDFTPNKFRDPVMEKKLQYVKSQLLDEPLKEIPSGIPSDNDIDAEAALAIEKLRKLVLIPSVTAGKRASQAAGTSSKRAKKSK